ncbi:hypothetical protein ACLMJK_000089 [Lecanora helva]
MSIRLSFPERILLAVRSRYTLSKSGWLLLLLGTFIMLLLISVLRVVWACFFYPHYRSPLRHLPKPPDRPSPFMGHFWQMLAISPGQALRSWVNEVPNAGLIRYLDLCNLERVVVTSPAAVAEVLLHRCYDFEKPPHFRKGIARVIGLGLFTAEGETHKKQRKHLMPAFAFRHVKNLYPMFWSISKELVAAIFAFAGKTDITSSDDCMCINVAEWSSRAALDIIGQGGFGESFNAIQDPDNNLHRTYREIFAPGRTGEIRAVLGFLVPQWVVRRLPFLRNDERECASNLLRSFCRSSIETKRQQLKTSPAGLIDILTVAMNSSAFSDENLVDQMMTFLAAGHETTASAFTWAVYLLAKHPQIQSNLRDQVRSQLPSLSKEPSSIVTSESFEKLSYLYAVCQEALRLFPPVAVTFRVAVKDTSICGQSIPKGTTVIIPPWAINGSEELWGPDAAEFRPERWQRKASSSPVDNKGTNYNYLTFLHGPRSCIGQSFALGELACLLAAWVDAFETELQDANYVPVIRGGIAAKPQDGLFVRLKAAPITVFQGSDG